MMQPGSFSHKIKVTDSTSARQRTSRLVLWILLSTLLVACGASSKSPAATGNQTAIPGKEEFGMTKDELVTSIETVESHISTCMRAAGFEYIAVDYNTVRRGMVADKSLPGMSEGEFFSQYGYGISTLYTGLAPQVSDISTPA